MEKLTCTYNESVDAIYNWTKDIGYTNSHKHIHTHARAPRVRALTDMGIQSIQTKRSLAKTSKPNAIPMWNKLTKAVVFLTRGSTF